MPGSLYYGDNLAVLRESIKDASVDLIYLDPPFNSNANYNVLFKAPSGQQSRAQIEAFEDTWRWGSEAEAAFLEVLRNPRAGDVGTMLQAMRSFLRENDMMAYLAMMAARLIELHRVLKPTGSLYLHCDPTASHYLKVLLDSIFGVEKCQNEIVWKRSHAHSDGRQGARHFGRVTDSILFYSKSDSAVFHQQFQPYGQHYIDRDYRRVEANGRRYRLDNIQGPGGAGNGNPFYEVMGVSRHWRYSKDRMDQLIAEGRIVQTKPGTVPQYKRYLDEMPGVPLQSLWADMPGINNRSDEFLGYPTQKPLSLLERIITSSSNEGDMILDPFCGCGTAVHAAEKLGRNWIGIDVTHLAISLIERRLRDAFPGVSFDVHGTPKDFDGARDLALRDKYQFQWWAVSLVDAVPYGGKKKGADSGIDGWRYMAAGRNTVARAIISVKGGDNVSVQMLRDLRGVVEREKAEAGLFLTLAEPTRPMLEEAAKAGYFDSPFGGKRHPRLQIMTIESLLKGVRPDLPPLAIEAGFRRAEKEDRAEQDQGNLLALPGLDAPVASAARKGGKRGAGAHAV
nr:DNA methyltransferase [uncultured Rhodopila sp.]